MSFFINIARMCPASLKHALTLLFSKKKIIKFSEVALVYVHCNCLIDYIVTPRGYQPWNTANTTADICLLVKNGNKNSEAKYKVCSNIFLSAIWLLLVQYSPDVNHSTISSTTQRPSRTSKWGWIPKPDRAHQSDSSRKP